MKHLRQSMTCRLLAVLMLILSAPSALMAADSWIYPTSEPKTPFGGGNGMKDTPYLISTAQHLANLAYMVTTKRNSYSGKYFMLLNDIVLNDGVIASGEVKKESNGSVLYSTNKAHFDKLKEWQPIGQYGTMYDDDFKGIFDGGGHTISGVYVRKPKLSADKSYRHKGLFGNCKEARISNLTLNDCFISICAPDGGEFTTKTGCLVGLAKSTTITNCHATGCVVSCDGDVTMEQWSVGGLVGETEDSSLFYDSSYEGVVDAYAESTYKSSWFANNSYMGGLVGHIGTTEFQVERCRTKGSLLFRQKNTGGTASVYVGGVIGGDKGSDYKAQHVAYCGNEMNISLFNKACLAEARTAHAHGIISGVAECVECANRGTVSFGGDEGYVANVSTKSGLVSVGGISQKGDMFRCINYGDISIAPMRYANGMSIAPWVNENPTTKKCFALNKITYRFDSGEPVLRIWQESDDDYYETRQNDYYVELYKTGDDALSETVKRVDKAIFKKDNYPAELNEAWPRAFGQIIDESDPLKGYLYLTCLGASLKTLDGHGTEADPYLVTSYEDLKAVHELFSSDEKTEGLVFKLTDNIDLTDKSGYGVFEHLTVIGSDNHPFDGIFDGDGHYIRGVVVAGFYKSVEGTSMFGVVAGTVKNLALDNIMRYDENCGYGGIARQLNSGGRIENCSVTGETSMFVRYSNYLNFGGICLDAKPGSIITDCSFVGKVKMKTDYFGADHYCNLKIGGIALQAGGTIRNCLCVMDNEFDIKSVYPDDPITVTVGGIVASKADGAVLENNYYYIGETKKSVNSANKVTFNDAQSSDGATAGKEKIDASLLGSAWVDGLYHPVVKGAYHYACKDYNGNGVALDQWMRTPTNNDILTLVPTAANKTDTKLWQLPNVAVYSEEYGAEMLTNFNIIPDQELVGYPLRYKASKEGVDVKGMATYVWTVKPHAVNWRPFCLPGGVELENLPEGCRLYVGGKLVKDSEGTRCKMNIVEVESVPAGVPFLLCYDNETDNEEVVITMTGDLAMTPRKADESSALEGTFSRKPGSYAYSEVVEETTDGKTTKYLKNTAGYDSFSAYIAYASTDRIELVDYLLLDELSNETDDVIKANDGKTLNVKLRRNIRTGGWNTLCLPFGVSGEEVAGALGSGTRVEELASVDYDATAGAVELKFKRASAIEAGRPYLVLPESEGSIFDLGQRTITGTVEPATFSVTLGDASPADISMVGSFARFYLASTDDENQYFIQQDKFYRATQANPITSDGYRCYFCVKSTGGAAVPSLGAARVVHADGTVTNIRLIDTGLGTADTRIYDMQGRQHSGLQRGVNIVGGKKIVRK